MSTQLTRSIRSRRTRIAASLLLPLAIGLTSCSTATTDASSPAADAATSTTASAPQRIVALSLETADIALQLVGPDRIVAVPASALKPTSANQSALAAQVANTLPSGTNPDPESILAFNPDLVLNTTRHDGEAAAGQQLETTGVTVVNLDADSFVTPEAVAEATRQIGEAVGEQSKAEELATTFTAAIAELDKQVPADGADTAPRFAALMSRGTSIMAMPSNLMMPGLATRAGGTNAGDAIGLTATRPIDAEALVAMNPDILFIEDFQGKGRGPFEELLANPALANVPAIANNAIVLIPATEASGASGLNTATGYQKIIAALQ